MAVRTRRACWSMTSYEVSSMIRFHLRDPTDAVRGSALHLHVGRPLPVSDAILLCSFGVDAGATQSHAQLRCLLLSAGYAAPLARHLIRSSPLLRRLRGNRYELRPFER